MAAVSSGIRRPRTLPWPAGLAGVGAVATALALGAVVASLVSGVLGAPVHWGQLLSGRVWDPSRGVFGAAAMIWGTAAVCAVALAVATPIGWSAAITITELTASRPARLLRAGVELLAAVPSIVYGLIGVAVVRPAVSAVFGVPGGDSLLAAGLVLAVMVLPTLVAVSVDALAGVPAAPREAAAALGLTRSEVIRSAVVPYARRGMRAAVLLSLARALGETIAVFLVIGRADGRLPSPSGALSALVRPGQSLTTKLGGPEPVLAGATGPHRAALYALALLLLAVVAASVLAGQRRRGASPIRARRSSHALAGANRDRRDQLVTVARRLSLAVPLVLVAAVIGLVVSRGYRGLAPSFWLGVGRGASGGGVRDHIVGTLVVVGAAGVIAVPVSAGLGLLLAVFSGPRTATALRMATVTLGGVPSVLLGLVAYDLVSVGLGWGKSWLAGAIALAVIVVPVAAVTTAARLDDLPPSRSEAALALGLTRTQLVGSVLVPHARSGLVTGTLLGLARAAGETAPLLFTATVFSGAGGFPHGIVRAPVVALPTHIFALAQDAAEPAAVQAAWGSALVLLLLAGALLAGADVVRNRAARRS